jgi:hypothetical protein
MAEAVSMCVCVMRVHVCVLLRECGGDCVDVFLRPGERLSVLEPVQAVALASFPRACLLVEVHTV